MLHTAALCLLLLLPFGLGYADVDELFGTINDGGRSQDDPIRAARRMREFVARRRGRQHLASAS